MRVILEETYDEISNWVSLYIKYAINQHNNSNNNNLTKEINKPFILGLPTGSTPLKVYQNLVKYYQDGQLSFKNVITFNMDEYVGLSPDNKQSYHYFMYHNFFNHIDIPRENIHILDGMSNDLQLECDNYERTITKYGNIDLFLCVVGSDGHIAFNEAGSSLSSRTRMKTLSDETISDNSRFFDNINEVPTKVLTVGIQTIMDAKQIILMASGINKATAVKNCIEGHITNQYTCTAIQNHPSATVIIDRKATAELKVKTFDYYTNLQKTVDLLGRPIENPIKKYISPMDKILITSPHPDDDVIGMGGTMQLFPNIANVSVVYMTNGIGGLRGDDNLGTFTRIKEAMSSVKVFGYDTNQVIDGTLPFYNTESRKTSSADMEKMEKLMEELQPNHIFVCSDPDPKKTHIKCLDIMKQCKFPKCVKYIWLYKSAWEKWSDCCSKSNCCVYIARDVFEKKLLSIDMHISQIKPMVTYSREINTFKQIALENNKSEIYPNCYQEEFLRVDCKTFTNTNTNC